MKQPIVLEAEFVASIPDKLEERTLYVSMEYATVAHKCCCGCGLEVVTPLSPTDWNLTYDGVSVSLHPSIGNWGFPCRSHYWINGSKVRWAGQMTREQIDVGRVHDRWVKQKYFAELEQPARRTQTAEGCQGKTGIWSWLSRLWS